jgi:hypothetical protein
MRRKQGTLVPLEETILEVARGFAKRGSGFYGYQLKFHIASHIQNGIYGGYRGAATGTTYRALARLVKMGYLESSWEESPNGNRPRRRYYKLTENMLKNGDNEC